MKREREVSEQIDAFSGDVDLIQQVQKKSREDRQSGRIYDQQAGLDYLRF